MRCWSTTSLAVDPKNPDNTWTYFVKGGRSRRKRATGWNPAPSNGAGAKRQKVDEHNDICEVSTLSLSSIKYRRP